MSSSEKIFRAFVAKPHCRCRPGLTPFLAGSAGSPLGATPGPDCEGFMGPKNCDCRHPSLPKNWVFFFSFFLRGKLFPCQPSPPVGRERCPSEGRLPVAVGP